MLWGVSWGINNRIFDGSVRVLVSCSFGRGLFLVCWGIWSSFYGIHSFSPKYPLVVRQPKTHLKPWTAEMGPSSLGGRAYVGVATVDGTWQAGLLAPSLVRFWEVASSR